MIGAIGPATHGQDDGLILERDGLAPYAGLRDEHRGSGSGLEGVLADLELGPAAQDDVELFLPWGLDVLLDHDVAGASGAESVRPEGGDPEPPA